ncbi:MAG: hypothetical protein ACRD6X_04285 [Pyrinomonadaceae bacterium]
MERTFFIATLLLLFAMAAAAQITVNPNGVNVNSQNPTTVFLTFGPVPADYLPAEAIWCGELIPATPPALGLQCRLDTIYGSLPLRYNLSTASGGGGFTDIMAIPPSVVRRAYLAALNGANAGFFYVRRFVSSTGGPDQFVNVTCRMSAGGARVPFALTNVEIKTPKGEPVLFLRAGEKFPEISAEIQYNGTGRLKGRWEIVQPGEELPSSRDLLTEATLPLEERGTQRRFTQVGRFNHFLPPGGKFKLLLENADRQPLIASGQYLLLLRIEAVDDKESDSNLGAVGAGIGIVHSGAVASFPMPFLRYFVQGESAAAAWESNGAVLPLPDTKVGLNEQLVFTWKEAENAAFYKLEVEDEKQAAVLSALLASPANIYVAPSWLAKQFAGRSLTWTVTAIDETGKQIGITKRRKFTHR